MSSFSKQPVIVWLRIGDLRLADNPALHALAGWSASGRPCIPVYVHEERQAASEHAPGAASRWWLHENLQALDAQLQSLGARLILRRTAGRSSDELLALAEECGASAIFWNGGSASIQSSDERWLCKALEMRGIGRNCHADNRLFSPTEIFTASGKPFQVFTPFYKACLRLLEERAAGGIDLLDALPAPLSLPLAAPLDDSGSRPRTLALKDLNLLPSRDWYGGMAEHWQPGEHGAELAVQRFLASRGPALYPEQRDFPATEGTSKLSPYLHFGNLTARQLWRSCRLWQQASGIALSGLAASPEGWKERDAHPSAASKGVEAFLRQLIWREFAHHLLHHFPHTVDQPLREDFAAFPWAQPVGAGDSPELLAWKRGQTGYPIVDAAMRELWHTGWMHNRCRMIVASFLCKHLLIPWQEGAAWFWDTLVDADLANNTLGWQWVAGCGADAAPYFRIFNPVLQGEKFDPRGDYVRRWCPELAALPDKLIHAPWTASPLELASAGVTLVDSLRDAEKLPAHKVGPLPQPGSYPRPIVDHSFARDRALAAYSAIKRN